MINKTFIFDKILKGVLGTIDCSITKDDYTLNFFNSTNNIEEIHVKLRDIKDNVTLFLYSKWFGITGKMLIVPEKLETNETLRKYESKEERFNDFIYITDDKIFLTTIYLGAYKSKNNHNTIPEEMINITYELLSYIHNNQRFQVKSKECVMEISLNLIK